MPYLPPLPRDSGRTTGAIRLRPQGCPRQHTCRKHMSVWTRPLPQKEPNDDEGCIAEVARQISPGRCPKGSRAIEKERRCRLRGQPISRSLELRYRRHPRVGAACPPRRSTNSLETELTKRNHRRARLFVRASLLFTRSCAFPGGQPTHALGTLNVRYPRPAGLLI